MTPICEQILAHWQVRKTQKQKDAFIAFMKEQMPELQVEQGGFGNNKNLVVGDISSAKVICTAHYDTCARMPVPNFLTPKNMAAYLGYALLLCIPMVAVMLLLRALLGIFTDNTWVLSQVPYFTGIASLLLLLTGGPPNPHTVNDNTSGVITLCELMAALSPEERSKTAFVFFDNEENGLLGSAWFAKRHKKDDLKQKLILNFDCVSDGDHILLVQSRSARKVWGAELAEAFVSTGEHTVHLERSATTLYPSDQGNFTTSVGIAAMKRKKGLGLYLDRIHTAKDTVFREENITYLVESTKKLLKKVETAHEAQT